MSALHGDSLRLGALLARLDHWLSGADGDSPVESTSFDRNQIRAIDAAYDRRTYTSNGTPNPQPRKAS